VPRNLASLMSISLPNHCLVSKEVTATDVLQFRRALDLISNECPCLLSFGTVSTRAECVEATNTVFERLCKGSSNAMLNFDVLCWIARRPDGSADRTKIRELIQVFRPCRKGMISKLDFIQSIDRYVP
jgi:hypothetical protein